MGACALHGVNFVHLDIKPSNIVSFGGMWKLIDLDSIVPARSKQNLDEITCTASYVAPELAGIVTDANSHEAEVSRFVDVWSVGLCALETVILRPVLEVIVGLQE